MKVGDIRRFRPMQDSRFTAKDKMDPVKDIDRGAGLAGQYIWFRCRGKLVGYVWIPHHAVLVECEHEC